VSSRVEAYSCASRTRIPLCPDAASAPYSVSIDADISADSDEYLLRVEGFVTPPALYRGTLDAKPPRLVHRQAEFFDARGFKVQQHEARSTDGTLIPYFQIGAADTELEGTRPTVIYGYGGFGQSELPTYLSAVGSAFLDRGGIYVVANIRGGGEFGPEWHQNAIRELRHRSYEDFGAVAEAVIDRGVTEPRRLGAIGASNGGLLVGNMLTRRPELFRALVCQVPLLDMRRYHRLLAGAAWLEEYGDPDEPEQWEFIRPISPYHNVSKNARYPRTLFMTSTRDDRVHPAHARKMVAKLCELGHDVLYYENTEGGHGLAATHAQAARMTALAYTFLWRELTAE